MNCTYSNPVDYQGNTPSTDLTAFNFTNADCTLPPATQSTTTATQTAVFFEPQTLQAISDTIRVDFYATGVMIFLLAVIVALNIFKR